MRISSYLRSMIVHYKETSPFLFQTIIGGLGIYSAVANVKLGLMVRYGTRFLTHYGSARAAAASRDCQGKAGAQCASILADSLVKDLVANWQEKVYSVGS